MGRAITTVAKQERRAALLDVALDEFFEKGFNAARMDDIAARAGLSKGTLYLYFASKEALFTALIDDLARPNLDAIEQIAAAAPSLFDALDRLAAYAPVMIRTSKVPRLMKVLIGDSHNFPAIVTTYRVDILERVLTALARMLDNARSRGEIETDDPALLARLLIAPMLFSGIWQAVFGRAPDAAVNLEGLFRMHVDLIIRALSPKQPSPKE